MKRRLMALALALLMLMATAPAGAQSATREATAAILEKARRPIKVTGIELDANTLELWEGQHATLTASILPSDATKQGVAWKSSNKKIVTVNKYGDLIARRLGKATITATAKGNKKKKAKCVVYVRAENLPTPVPTPTPTPEYTPTPTPTPTPPADGATNVPAPSTNPVPSSVGMRTVFKSSASNSISFTLYINNTFGEGLSDYGVMWEGPDGTPKKSSTRIGDISGARMELTLRNLQPNTEYTVVGYAVRGGQLLKSAGFRTRTKP